MDKDKVDVASAVQQAMDDADHASRFSANIPDSIVYPIINPPLPVVNPYPYWTPIDRSLQGKPDRVIHYNRLTNN